MLRLLSLTMALLALAACAAAESPTGAAPPLAGDKPTFLWFFTDP